MEETLEPESGTHFLQLAYCLSHALSSRNARVVLGDVSQVTTERSPVVVHATNDEDG